MLKRFLKDRRGNIAMMFGLVSIPLIAATGAAIDYSHAYEQRQVVQDALDAAALAANKLIGMATEDEIFAEAQSFFLANTDEQINNSVTLHMQIDGGSVHLWTTLNVPTYFLGIVGVDDINFNISSVSIAGAATYEVVLVLDNSTSMRGTKIATLKIAATDLVNSLFALAISNPADNPVRVGLVPFAASVNVGSQYQTASWLDTTGISPDTTLNFTTNAAQAAWWAANYPGVAMPNNVFGNFSTVFNLGLNGYTWGGCVEARAHPYDVDDTTPTPGVPATLFTPMFAPDEPDTTTSSRYGGTTNVYGNNYLDDEGGACVNSYSTTSTTPTQLPWYCSYWPWLSQCSGGGTTTTTVNHTINLGEEQLQERACKYNTTLPTAYRGLGVGPNLNCTVNALTPMTESQTALIAAITAMNAPQSPVAYTDIEQGVVWGWRLLSSTAPFTEGRDYGDAGNHKIMIVMTDGANTYVSETSNNNINRSQYMAYNYVAHGLLGTTSTNNNTVVDAMNDRTLEVCANVQATEITVYTIAFEVDDDDAAQILHDCASDPSKAFDADNEAELIATFRLIAQDIATLRIAE